MLQEVLVAQTPWKPFYVRVPVTARQAKAGERVEVADSPEPVTCEGDEWIVRENGLVTIRHDLDREDLVRAKDFLVCVNCGCTEFDPCPDGCAWASPTRCTACPT